MPEFTSAIPGNVCWIELQTTDPAAARPFYADLLGWSLSDMPGPTPYAMAGIGGKMVAGILELPAQARTMGAPPHWLSYIAVDDVKASSEKAAGLGARLLVPPMQMGPGSFAVIQDPTGAVFALWHSPVPMGTFLVGEPGALGWNEIMTTDVEAARRFYTGLFGWRSDASPMPGGPAGSTYTTFWNGEHMAAGMMQITPDMVGVPSHWGIYFAVADADGTHAAAVKAGATSIVPPTDIPTVGRFAVLDDPQGAGFSVIQFFPRAS